ncbi:MAG: hypothetical protein Tsb009_31280 [Planctomycetaceae bacterium]
MIVRILIALLLLLGGLHFAQANFEDVKSSPSVRKSDQQQDSDKKNSSRTGKSQPSGKKTKTPKPEVPLEFRPYRVRISLAIDWQAKIAPRLRQRVFADLKDAIDRSYGRMWTVEMERNRWLPLPGEVGLKRLTGDQLLERFRPQTESAPVPFDKLFVLTLQRRGPRFLLAGREWDTKSRKLSILEKTSTNQPREVGRKLFALLPKLFHPVFSIESVNGTEVDLRLQAAMFPAIDPSVAQVRVNDVITPYFRYLDKNHVVQKIRSIPWTYIIIDKVDQQFITGSMVTDRGGRLGTGRRRRVEVLGNLVRPRFSSSRLKMVYQTDETKPLVGYHINLIPKRFYRDKRTEPLIRRFSGRDGIVQIPVNPRFPIIWVYVYSGSALLARVPYCPGVSNNETIPVPDDSIRLAVEGEISLLKNELIDVVARRATLMALAKKISDDESIPAAKKEMQIDEKFAMIAQLPGIEEFEDKLTKICYDAGKNAEKLKNRFAVRKIKKMWEDTSKLVAKFLDPEPVRKFRQELREAAKK